MAGSRPGIREGLVHGWPAVHLTSDLLEVTVLPGKGADIYALTDLGSGIDPLFKAPWGLQPPGSPPRDGSEGAAFLENYEGGWQELFPNTNDPASYRGLISSRSTARSPRCRGRGRWPPMILAKRRCGSPSSAA